MYVFQENKCENGIIKKMKSNAEVKARNFLSNIARSRLIKNRLQKAIVYGQHFLLFLITHNMNLFLFDRIFSSLNNQQTVICSGRSVCLRTFINILSPKKFMIPDAKDASYNKVETIVHDYLMQAGNFVKLLFYFKYNYNIYQDIYNNLFAQLFINNNSVE